MLKYVNTALGQKCQWVGRIGPPEDFCFRWWRDRSGTPSCRRCRCSKGIVRLRSSEVPLRVGKNCEQGSQHSFHSWLRLERILCLYFILYHGTGLVVRTVANPRRPGFDSLQIFLLSIGISW